VQARVSLPSALELIRGAAPFARAGNHSEFERSVRWVSTHLTFDLDSSVSVFETNIRVLGALRSVVAALSAASDALSRAGGLLSAHLLASDPATGHAARPPARQTSCPHPSNAHAFSLAG
jgi:mannosidase alpha-like ER degradation enhancer 2